MSGGRQSTGSNPELHLSKQSWGSNARVINIVAVKMIPSVSFASRLLFDVPYHHRISPACVVSSQFHPLDILPTIPYVEFWLTYVLLHLLPSVFA